MENRADITPGDQFAATLDWWRDAGVDYLFTDEIEPLLASEAEEVRTAPVAKPDEKTPKPPEPAIKVADLPDTLDAFRNWWAGPDNPFAQRHGMNFAPVGKPDAPLMVLTTMPEADDRDSLLSGPQGVMVGNILRAIGLDPNLAYLASALPCHTTLPDWDQLAQEGLGTVVAHHVALARPQRVLMFGSKLPALLGHEPAAPPESFAAIGETRTLATFAPDRLLDHARQRARLWRRLCQWTAQ